MLLSKLLRFIVLLASLIASISTENVYTVTPTTILSPNLQYINTSQLRQKTPKSAQQQQPGGAAEQSANYERVDDPLVSSSSGSYERKSVRVDKTVADLKSDKSRAALKQLFDRRLIKSANDYAAPNRTRTIERLVGGYLSKYNPPPDRRKSSTTTTSADISTKTVEEDSLSYSTHLPWTTTTPIATSSPEIYRQSVSSTIQNIISTTIWPSSTADEDLLAEGEEDEEEERAVEDKVTTTTTTSAPTWMSTTTLSNLRRATTTRVPSTRLHYYDIRQNSNKPSIKSPGSSSSAASSPSSSLSSTSGIKDPSTKSSSSSSSTGSKLNTKIYFKRKNETLPNRGATHFTGSKQIDTIKVPSAASSSSSTENKLINSNSLSSASQIKIATTAAPSIRGNEIVLPTKTHYLTDSLEDAALLEIDQQLDNWDNGLLRASAGAGLESSAGTAKPESKKTLSDQVAEGKYGLIQKELFDQPVQRPGVLSYDKNPEVPKDTKQNYGGLKDEEIWFAEDHVLVIKGGGLSSDGKDWVPIDAYEAPKRPVKIPNNPEVPPPFPVQLEENGPIQFIGNNQAPFFGAFPNGSVPPPPFPGAGPNTGGGGGGGGNGQYPPPPGGYNSPNLPPWPGSVQNFTADDGYNYPPPIPNPFLTYGPPGYPPGPPFGPNGPPPPFINGSLENVNNTLDYPDEDDPSLYYPPPYSFVYKNNYSNPVPPGPLVPGIVLPPPPNFFTRLEGSLSSSSSNGKHNSNRTALRKRPPQRVPIVRPHNNNNKIPNNEVAINDSPLTKITKLTTTNLPPTIRRPTTTLPPTTTINGRTTTHPPQQPPPPPTRLVNNNNINQQNVYHIPKYKDQENIVINYEPPRLPPILNHHHNQRPPQQQHHQHQQQPKPVVLAEFDEDHYQNTVEPPPATKLTVTQLKKVNDPLIKFISGSNGGGGGHGGKVNGNSNPIYFEYFDAGQKGAGGGGGHRTSTPGPTYIPVTRTPTTPLVTTFDYEKYLYVTPQPEIRPNGEPPQLTIHTQPDIIYQRLPVGDPLKSSFNHEVETIRQTLNYYQTQPQLIPLGSGGGGGGGIAIGAGELDSFQNQVPRTPKAKPVYQYSFDVTEGGGGGGIISSTSPKYVQSSLGPGLLDTTPFKPMVQYSAPLGSQADKDGFKPFPPSPAYFHSTTPNSIPVSTPQQQQQQQQRPAKTRSKLLPVHQQQVVRPQHQQQQQQQQQINLNGDHLYNLQFGPIGGGEGGGGGGGNVRGPGYLRNVKPGSSFTGYYYDQPPQHHHQQQHHTASAADPYMQQIAALRQKLRHHSTFHEFYQHPNYNHFNGSSALRYHAGPSSQSQSSQQYQLPRPNSRFTDNHNYNHRLEQQQQQHYQNLLAPQSQNTQYYSPSRIQTHPQTVQQQQQAQQQQQQFLSLEKDILVNYKYPLPAGNPDAETLPAEFLEEHRPPAVTQRPSFYNSPPQFAFNGNQQQFYQYRLPGDQAHVFFLAPQQENKRTRQAKSVGSGGSGGEGRVIGGSEGGAAETTGTIKRRR